MNTFLKGFASELVKLSASTLGAFVAAPPKKAPVGASSKTELEKLVAGGVNKAMGPLGATVNKPHKLQGGKLDMRPPKPPR